MVMMVDCLVFFVMVDDDDDDDDAFFVLVDLPLIFFADAAFAFALAMVMLGSEALCWDG